MIGTSSFLEAFYIRARHCTALSTAVSVDLYINKPLCCYFSTSLLVVGKCHCQLLITCCVVQSILWRKKKATKTKVWKAVCNERVVKESQRIATEKKGILSTVGVTYQCAA